MGPVDEVTRRVFEQLDAPDRDLGR
jgi:hypothetical protein